MRLVRTTARRHLRVLLTALVLAATAGACSRNPATGGLQLSLISEERAIAMGRQGDADIVRTMGVYEDPELQAYVEELGQAMAGKSERPGLPWTFRIVDEPVVNAFALPGGFIYVTRTIVAHFNTGAQLAAVLGHEIGHVTAQHSVNQMSQAQLANIGLGIGTILSPEIAQFRGLISTGLQLAFLKFSRDDERQADDLGYRYMTRIGYDPREMPEVFEMLARVSSQRGGNGVPGWLSTHPAPEDRRERIQERISAADLDFDTLAVDRARFLRKLDGIVWGHDPRNGYFRESTFLHPGMEFRLDFPTGWQTTNRPEAVVAQSPDQDAVVLLSLAREESAVAALQAFFDEQGVAAGRTWRTPVNGLPAEWASFRGRTDQGTLAGIVVFIEYSSRVYRIMGYAPERLFGRYEGTFEATLGSFDRLSDPEALSVEPKRIEIVELPEAMTVEEFHRRWPSTVPLEEVALVNQARVGETLEAGRLVKRIVGEGAPDDGR